MEEKQNYLNDRIEGRNPVIEALRSGREIDKILVAKGETEGSVSIILSKARERGIQVQEVDRRKLNELSETGNHQGVLAFVAMHEYAEVSDLLKRAEEKGETPFLIALDQLTDPHNLGSVIRTANAVGAHGVIIPKRRAVGLTAVVAKTAAGALEYTPVAKVTNLTRTLEELKEKGIWVIGADMGGTPLFKSDLKGPICLVIGAEGDGISRLVRETCDMMVSIPMNGEIESLNASVAAGIMMYETLRQRETGKGGK
ncbi:MAG: 23S rRNA (guanosine(2251)-2'-O)-methyltransferase RlmB [Clostridia bacterium]|nr:23S rRNA (guanosine(2251)-2'-O)-methyltransferase RlmB [Clostridia bacterium]